MVLMSTSSVKTDYWYDEAAAQKAVDFFPLALCHVKGEWAGQPISLLPWQENDVIRPLFGWKRPDGTRRYRTCFVEVPRKNGKSTIAAGIGLYLLFADGEPGAEVYSAAADRSQAAIVFDIAKQMVAKSPMLAKRARIFQSSIMAPATGSSYKVLSADVETKYGYNASGIIFDELHTQANRRLWDALITATGVRRQPLTFVMTTAGYDRHSVCWEQHDYAMKVKAGIIQDDSYLGVIYAADENDDWTDPKVWAKANPSLGNTLKLDYVATECQHARDIPGYENTFKRLQLNIWTEQATRWLGLDTWDACAGEVDLALLEGRDCFGGIDLSSTQDTTALALVFPGPDGYDTLSWFWVPEESIRKRSERDRVPYDIWARDGFIEETEGNVVDYDIIRKRVNELGQRFHIKEIAIDRWNSTDLQTRLQGDGFTVVPFGQGFASMTAPAKELEKLLLSRKLRHGGNPVLRWMASVVAVSQDAAGNLKPDKAKSTERIDGIVALIMALGRAMVQPDGWSMYETERLLVI